MITAGLVLTALIIPAWSEQIINLSIPVDSMDGGCHPRNDGVWSVSGHPIPTDIGIGWMVNPFMDEVFVFHDHHYIGDNTPDPSRAVVTLEFDEPVMVSGLDIVEHTNGITRVEGFAGNLPDVLLSVGSVFGSKGDVTGGFQFNEGEVNAFQFATPISGRFFQFIVRKTSLSDGYAAYRVFLHYTAQHSDWTLRATTGPSRRTEYALAYDRARGQTVLFGGFDVGLLGDTWEYDGVSWSQRATTGPAARYRHALAYDSARGVTVLFGGSDTAVAYDDTWVWDGTTWTQNFPAMSPSARYMHAMAYDSARGVTVLFGGIDSSSEGDTWEWNGADWTQRATTGPVARNRHGMAYDSKCGVTVLFGGSDGSGTLLNDTWEWNGTTWTQRASTGPSPRLDAALAYDSGRDVTVLFGGYDGGYAGDTWEWDGTTWTQRESDTGPPARFYHSIAFDSARAATVLFGGWNGTLLGDTWDYLVCSGEETVKKTGCKASHGANLLKVVLTGGVEGNSFTVSLTDGSTASGSLNSRGKGKVKFANRPPGDSGTATAEWSCGFVAERDYSCP